MRLQEKCDFAHIRSPETVCSSRSKEQQSGAQLARDVLVQW